MSSVQKKNAESIILSSKRALRYWRWSYTKEAPWNKAIMKHRHLEWFRLKISSAFLHTCSMYHLEHWHVDYIFAKHMPLNTTSVKRFYFRPPLTSMNIPVAQQNDFFSSAAQMKTAAELWQWPISRIPHTPRHRTRTNSTTVHMLELHMITNSVFAWYP